LTGADITLIRYVHVRMEDRARLEIGDNEALAGTRRGGRRAAIVRQGRRGFAHQG
jgi:hypothetical protein